MIVNVKGSCSSGSESAEVSPDKNKKKIENQTPEAIPLPDKTVKKIKTKEEKKQNPKKVDKEVKQVSEFEKKDLFDPNNIAALIDKSKEETAEVIKKNKTQKKLIQKLNNFLKLKKKSYLIQIILLH